MAKRTFIQVEVSSTYKAELQRLIGPYMPMANEVKRLLAKEYPTLLSIDRPSKKAFEKMTRERLGL
jgi:hypothetical protein